MGSKCLDWRRCPKAKEVSCQGHMRWGLPSWARLQWVGGWAADGTGREVALAQHQKGKGGDRSPCAC